LLKHLRLRHHRLCTGQAWSAVVPGGALAAAVAAALAVGAVAGVYPARRAARLSTAQALRAA